MKQSGSFFIHANEFFGAQWKTLHIAQFLILSVPI